MNFAQRITAAALTPATRKAFINDLRKSGPALAATDLDFSGVGLWVTEQQIDTVLADLQKLKWKIVERKPGQVDLAQSRGYWPISLAKRANQKYWLEAPYSDGHNLVNESQRDQMARHLFRSGFDTRKLEALWSTEDSQEKDQFFQRVKAKGFKVYHEERVRGLTSVVIETEYRNKFWRLIVRDLGSRLSATLTPIIETR